MQDEDQAPTSNVSGSQGVVAGSGNVQNNHFGSSAPSFLTTLSPHKAVERLRAMPYDDARSALTSAPPDDVAEILKVLLRTDEALAVALLADLKPRTAKSLLTPLTSEIPWLERLQRAAEAISDRAVELNWGNDARVGILEHAATARLKGFFRTFSRGLICWTDDGMRTIHGTTAHVYTAKGGPSGSLGFPVSDGEDHDWYRLQRFEGGAIFCSDAGTFAVRSAILGCLRKNVVFISDEIEAPPSPFSTSGTIQNYLPSWREKTAVVSSEKYGTHSVGGPMLDHYLELGGTASWLGFPVDGWNAVNAVRGQRQGWTQDFEGGTLYQSPSKRVNAVPAETVTLLSAPLRYGWPVTEEQPVGAGADRIQFFDKAVVTLREGERNLWVRPGG